MTPGWVTALRAVSSFLSGVGLATVVLLWLGVRRAGKPVPSSGMWWSLVTLGYAAGYGMVTRAEAFATRLPFSYRDIGTLVLVVLVDTTAILMLRFYRTRF